MYKPFFDFMKIFFDLVNMFIEKLKTTLLQSLYLCSKKAGVIKQERDAGSHL